MNDEAQIKVMLAYGTYIRLKLMPYAIKRNKQTMALEIDTNGLKKPNIVGLDLFAFNLYPQTSEFLPVGINMGTRYDEITKSFPK